MPKFKLEILVTAALGCLGAIDSVILGYYIVATLSQLTQFPQTEGLVLLSYAAAAATGFSFLTLALGSFLIMRGQRREGLALNCAGGICLIFMYVYFAVFSQPIVLRWLGICGYSLVVPSLLSVVVGLFAK